MKAMIKFLIPVLFVSAGQFIGIKSYAQPTCEELRVKWIFHIACGVTWQNEANINVYTIGVFSSKEEYDLIKRLTDTDSIKGKPVEVIRYTNYEDIKEHQIVYVTNKERKYLPVVYEKLKGKNVLIMSDRSKQPEYSVINFNMRKGSSQKFSLNEELLKSQGLRAQTTTVILGP